MSLPDRGQITGASYRPSNYDVRTDNFLGAIFNNKMRSPLRGPIPTEVGTSSLWTMRRALVGSLHGWALQIKASVRL